MKRLLLAFCIFVGCSHVNAQGAPGASDVSIEKALEECTKIASSLERLNCFDKVAQTPVIFPQEVFVTKPSAQSVQIIDFVKENEAKRSQGDMSFIKSETPELDIEGKEIGTQVIISAPGRDKNPINPRVYLAVSCILNITRLQIISPSPIERQTIRVQLLLDSKPMGKETLWQVLESGTVVDAGRGLVAIDLIRRLGQGKNLSISSDYAVLDGIQFEADGLNEHIQRERQACHW